jgi:hypothetical protein
MDNVMDAAARVLASPIPRRKAVKALTRIFMGALAVAVGVRKAAAASCGQLTNGCTSGYVCCASKCVRGAICCGTTTCSAAYSCVSGNCVSST